MVNTTSNMSNESNIVNIPFKFFSQDPRIEFDDLNGLTYYYDIDLLNNIDNFTNNVYYNIKRDFGVSKFEVIPNYHSEHGLDLKQYMMNRYENYKIVNIGQVISDDRGFYVRPISLTEEDISTLKEIHQRILETQTCPVCLDRVTDNRQYFNCQHEICGRCFFNWNSRMYSEYRETTCPICRGT